MTKSAEPLLENDAHEKFMKTTGHLWGYMCIRFKNQGHGLLPFGCNDLRSAALKAMGGKEDGFVQCPYCRASFTIGEVFFEYAIPLSRGGWFGVSNVEILCKLCSRRKGLLTTSEYYALLEFLETKIPLGRQDILNRIDRSTVFLGKKDQDE